MSLNQELISKVVSSEEYKILNQKYMNLLQLKNDQFNLGLEVNQEFFFVKALVINRFHTHCKKKGFNEKTFLKFLDLSYKSQINKLTKKIIKIKGLKSTI